jgi:hypothetical protein
MARTRMALARSASVATAAVEAVMVEMVARYR